MNSQILTVMFEKFILELPVSINLGIVGDAL